MAVFDLGCRRYALAFCRTVSRSLETSHIYAFSVAVCFAQRLPANAVELCVVLLVFWFIAWLVWCETHRTYTQDTDFADEKKT